MSADELKLAGLRMNSSGGDGDDDKDKDKNSPLKRHSTDKSNESPKKSLKRRLQDKAKQNSVTRQLDTSEEATTNVAAPWVVEKLRENKFKSTISQVFIKVLETEDVPDAENKPVRYVALADSTGTVMGKVAATELADEFRVGRSLRLCGTNWHPKEGFLIIQQSSKVSTCPNVTLPSSVGSLAELWAEYFKRNFTTIADLHAKNAKNEQGTFFNVRGVIIVFGDLETKSDTKRANVMHQRRTHLIQDETGSIELNMWSLDSARLFDEGCTVELSMFRLNNFKGKNTLNSNEDLSMAKVVHPPDCMKTYEVPDEYKERFGKKSPGEKMRIVGIYGRTIRTYAACTEPGCHMKKVDFSETPARCNNCKKIYNEFSDAKMAVFMKVEVEVMTGEQQHHVHTATLFTQSMQKLLPEMAEMGDEGFDPSIDGATIADAIHLPQVVMATFTGPKADILQIHKVE